MSKVYSESSFRDAFLDGAARTFFVSAYADHVEEHRAAGGFPQPGPGGNWDDYAPPTPPNAYALAGELWGKLELLNKVSVYVLAHRAEDAESKKLDADRFGSDLAMEAMGHGVSWFDDHARFEIEVPDVECTCLSFSDEAYKIRVPRPRSKPPAWMKP